MLSDTFAKLEAAVKDVNDKQAVLDKISTEKDFKIGKLRQEIENVEKSYEVQLTQATKAYADSHANAAVLREQATKYMQELLPELGQSRVRAS